MKVLASIVFLFAASWSRGATAEEEVSALLARMPSQAQVRWAREILKDPGPGLDERPKRSGSELEEARRLIADVKAIVPALRPLIRSGKSIFDYRGLIAHGELSWHGEEYELIIGVYLRGDQGQEPWEFRILFDSRGQILRIESVVYKE